MTDHFKTFGIPRTLTALPAVLERRFHELQRSYHPDKHVHAPGEVRTGALDKSSSINQAYRVLRDPIQRTKHLLSIHGLSVESAKQVPSALLMAVMEVQEKLAELEMANTPLARNRINGELSPYAEEFYARGRELEAQLHKLSEQWDAGEGPRAEPGHLNEEQLAILRSLTSLLAERAYLETLRQSIVAAQRGEPASIKH